MEMFKPTFAWKFWHFLWCHWRWSVQKKQGGRVDDYLFRKMTIYEKEKEND
jgi:hypothetical protein